MTTHTECTPGDNARHITDGRRDMEQVMEDQYQMGFISGIEYANRRHDNIEKISNFGDALAWFVIGLLGGLALALYVIFPAF